MIIDLTLSMKLIQSQLSCFQVNNAVDAIVVGKIVRQRAAKRRVTLICLTIAISFTITTLPYQIIVYAVIFADKQATTVKLVTPLRTVGTLNACISPVIFGLMWRPFQQSLMKVSLKPSIDTILDYERLQLMFWCQKERCSRQRYEMTCFKSFARVKTPKSTATSDSRASKKLFCANLTQNLISWYTHQKTHITNPITKLIWYTKISRHVNTSSCVRWVVCFRGNRSYVTHRYRQNTRTVRIIYYNVRYWQDPTRLNRLINTRDDIRTCFMQTYKIYLVLYYCVGGILTKQEGSCETRGCS